MRFYVRSDGYFVQKAVCFYAVFIYYSIFDLFGQAFFGKTRLFILQKMLFCGRICLEPGFRSPIDNGLGEKRYIFSVFYILVYDGKLALLCGLRFYYKSDAIPLI